MMVKLSTWQEQMSEDMRLRDFRARTQETYLLATRQFMDWAQRAPSRLTDEHVRAYILYMREEKKVAPSTINIAVHALRFFFRHTQLRSTP
jgi:integrase/recombinase XerD